VLCWRDGEICVFNEKWAICSNPCGLQGWRVTLKAFGFGVAHIMVSKLNI